MCIRDRFERGWVTLNANFRGKGAFPTNEFWHQKTRVPGLPYGEKIAENFKRLSRVHQRHRQTDDRQTDLRWHIANVTYTFTFAKKQLDSHSTCHRIML